MKLTNRYAGRKTPGRKPFRQDPFEEVRIFVPRWLVARLRRLGDAKGVSLERLIVRALWNVKNYSDMFDINLNLNNVAISQSTTAEQQSQVWDYLKGAKDKGIELELLIMCYEDLGFASYIQIKEVIRDLHYLGLVKIFNGDEGEVRIAAVFKKGSVREKGFRLFGGKKL